MYVNVQGVHFIILNYVYAMASPLKRKSLCFMFWSQITCFLLGDNWHSTTTS